MEKHQEFEEIKLVMMDWDLYRDDPIRSELNFQKPGTSVVFKDGEDVYRDNSHICSYAERISYQ